MWRILSIFVLAVITSLAHAQLAGISNCFEDLGDFRPGNGRGVAVLEGGQGDAGLRHGHLDGCHGSGAVGA